MQYYSFCLFDKINKFCYNIYKGRRCGILITIIFLLILIVFFIRGIKRGFLFSISSILAILLGIKIIDKYYTYFLNFLKPYNLPLFISKILIYLFVFIILFFLFKLITYLFTIILKAFHLNWLNNLLGGFSEAIKGLILIWFFIFLSLNIYPKTENFIKKSNFTYQIYNYGNQFYSTIEKKILKRDYLANLKNLLSSIKNKN
ncbi:MAG: CvpA family protein [candidate division WOR-3 bacterium]|nr:CvpA family protein [candidate division WOR-3 bacterium]